MPIYEYRCAECGTEFEVLVRSRRERILCKKCGSGALKKLISQFSSRTGPTACGPSAST